MKAKVVAAIAVVIIAGCGAAKEKGRPLPVVATVNGTSITEGQLKDRLRLLEIGFENLSGKPKSGPDAKIDLLSQLIAEEMYLEEARRLHISASEAEVDAGYARSRSEYPAGVFEKTLGQSGVSTSQYRESLARKITVEKLIQAVVYKNVKAEKAQVLEYFKEYEAEFQKPLRVKARQIVVDNRRDAEAILGEIKMGADFASLARARSFSPDGAAGGDLGFFSKGEMPPEFEAVVFRMKPGEVSKVVKTPYGYHIFKVEKVLRAEKPAFQEAEPEARKRLVTELGEDGFEKWRADLKARAKVEVNFDVLGRL